MLSLIKWLLDHEWNFHYEDGVLRFIYCNEEPLISNESEAEQILKELKANKNYKQEEA